MQPFNSLSLAPAAREWLANSRHPRILHVFDQACNLIDKRGEILSIVTPQIGNGPFNLVLEEDVLFSDHLDVQSSISINGNQLHLDDLTINTADAKRWQPRPDWEMLHARRVDVLNQLMPLSLPKYRPSIPNSLISDLSSALTKADISLAKTVASQLAGLGQGLTPSGDDFIMGAIYAAWIIHPHEVAGVLLKEITDVTVPLTTSLSAAWLRSAGNGEVGILWHEFFDVLTSIDRIGNPTHEILIQEAMDNILSIGETSGADALAGFLGVFNAYKERINDKCPS